MKFSILIPTFNSAKTIQDTIHSIRLQKFTSYEIIVIDNNSTDHTIQILKKNKLPNIKFIIEKDEGIYDAINKGILNARGDIISLLHSDDIYYNSSALQIISEIFDQKKIDIVYGDLVYVKKNNLNKIIRYWKCSSFYPGRFLKGWHPPHPTFFVKKKIYNKYGLYKNHIGNSADVELMYRFLETNKISSFYLNKILIKMRYGGKSNKKLSSILSQNLAIVNFLGINKSLIKVLLFFFYKIINRSKQFYFKPKK